MKQIAFTLFLLALLMAACKKESSSLVQQEQPQPEKFSEFDSCDCTEPLPERGSADYIKAVINGVPVCFDMMPAMNDTFPNMLKHGVILRDTGDQYYDNLYMLRNARNSPWQIAIFLENTHALTKTYPYDLPRANPEVCEIGELQLNDLNNYTSCTFCAENKWNYYGSFLTNMKLTVTSFKNNVFEGVFDGNVYTGNGKMATVTNGSFKIRLKVFSENIDVR